MPQPVSPSARIAVLVDCDNSSPEALAFALSLIPAQSRIVVRQGYGNSGTLTQRRWSETLNRLAFTPCMQFATGKNSADIALALDALELMLEGRADTFYLVTSDSDFASLCRKLRTRGAAAFIVGEEKTPPMLREACNAFHAVPSPGEPEQAAPAPPVQPPAAASVAPAAPVKPPTTEAGRHLLASVAALATLDPGGWVALPPLGQHLLTQHGLSAKKLGYSRLGKMIEACDALETQTRNGEIQVRVKKASGKPASVTPIRSAGK